MSALHVQQPLFDPPDVDLRTLRDSDRTVLEAIVKLGDLSAREAGRIVYRLNRRRRPLDPHVAYRSTGSKVLGRLIQFGLVEPANGGRFTARHPSDRKEERRDSYGEQRRSSAGAGPAR